MTKLSCVLLGLAACTGSSNNKTADASGPGGHAADAPAQPDAAAHDASAHDAAAHDAAPSTVLVVADCTGVSSADIAATITTTAADQFEPATAAIAAGQYVKFTTAGDHNFQNQPGATAASAFSSGPPGAQTACLQFTVAGSYPFECVVHAGMGMTGTLTVN